MNNSCQRIAGGLLLACILCACGSASPTISDRAASITAAALTAARVSTTAAPSPTLFLSPTPELSPTVSPTGPASPTKTQAPVIQGPVCDNAAYVSDVTIPDGTAIDPGDEFNKTWKLKNTGTCEWSLSYAIAFVSGNAMDGVKTLLTESIAAGEAVEITVKMAAPKTPGTYTGYWRMQNASGAFFGELVYVQIKVPGGEGTVTVTPAATNTGPAATDTPTPLPTDTPTAGATKE